MSVSDFMHQKEPKTNLDGYNSKRNNVQSSCHIFHAASPPGLLLDPALEVSNEGISFSQEEISDG